MPRDCNEMNLHPFSSNNWRASLVPAAAVIPAPIAYIKVVAVKKLVVGFLVGSQCPLDACAEVPCHPSVNPRTFTGPVGAQIFYLEKIRVFQAG